MPLVVSAGDVAVYDALTRRLLVATEALGAAGPRCADLLDGVRWSGQGANAALDEVQRLAQGLKSLSQRFSQLAHQAGRRRDELAGELSRRQAFQAAVLDDLGRLARAPGDLEAGLRDELDRIRGSLPAPGHQLWETLHHTVASLLP